MAEIRSLVLRITQRCNLKCDYCYAAYPGCRDMDMSVETALEAVALSCPEGGPLRIQFTGGEPLLNMAVMEAVYAFGLATGRKLLLSLQTNATLLTPDVARRLCTMHCAVGVSLDGLPAANALRHFPDGTPAYEKAIEGIRNLGRVGVRCNLTTVVTSRNAADLGQLPDLALWLGNVAGVGLDLFRPLGRGTGQHLTPEEGALTKGLSELTRKTQQIRQAGIPFRLRELERLKKRAACPNCDSTYCYAQTALSLCIDPAGDCWPCSSLAGRREFLLGNIRQGLPGEHPCRQALSPPEKCSRCPTFPLCKGGCPAGRLGCEPDPMTCLLNRLLLEELKV